MTAGPPTPEAISFDALVPAEMARKAEEVGVRKSALDLPSLIVLAVLAGAFISLGAIFSLTTASGAMVVTGPDGAISKVTLPFGVTRLLAGVTFSLGLILVIVAGAELFTGNVLLVIAWAGRRITTGAVLRNWALVFLGNLVGALGTVALVVAAGWYRYGGGAVGSAALATAQAKIDRPFLEALAAAILCNGLVCLAVWLTYSARTTTDRILAIVPPIAAFVAAGFEHSVANMFFLPLGVAIATFAPDSFWAATGLDPAAYAGVTVEGAALNLVPVTIGNIIGGAVAVAAVYWFVYLRHRQGTSPGS